MNNKSLDYIGVTSILDIRKRDFLLFDKIAILDSFSSHNFLSEMMTALMGEQERAEFDWLVEKGLCDIVDPFTDMAGISDIPDSLKKLYIQIFNGPLQPILADTLPRLQGKPITDDLMLQEMEKMTDKILEKLENKELVDNAFDMTNQHIRLTSIYLRTFKKQNAYPIRDTSVFEEHLDGTNKTVVLNTLIDSFPSIDETVPWEHIIDFKSDPDSKTKLIALRNWINKITKNEIDVNELKDEVAYLINEYKVFLRFHKMKTNTGTLQLTLKVPFDILENLIKIKWSKLPDVLFIFKKRQIELLEAELNAPGRELAYIIKSQDEFTTKHLKS